MLVTARHQRPDVVFADHFVVGDLVPVDGLHLGPRCGRFLNTTHTLTLALRSTARFWQIKITGIIRDAFENNVSFLSPSERITRFFYFLLTGLEYVFDKDLCPLI